MGVTLDGRELIGAMRKGIGGLTFLKWVKGGGIPPKFSGGYNCINTIRRHAKEYIALWDNEIIERRIRDIVPVNPEIMQLDPKKMDPTIPLTTDTKKEVFDKVLLNNKEEVKPKNRRAKPKVEKVIPKATTNK